MNAPIALKDLLTGANQLFSLPDIYFQLSELLHNPRSTSADIGKVIAKDPGLSARLLRLVNSPFYGFQSKIDTITRAITVVGIDELYNLVVATCVVDRFDRIPCELVDMTAFWLRSVHCGVVARLLARHSLVLHTERLFLAGLLHDIGSLLLYQKLPELSGKVLLATGHDRRLLADFEQEIIGFTHAEVSSELLKSWNLPESLYLAIANYLQPELASQHRLDAFLLNIATRLVDGSERGVPIARLVEEFSAEFLAGARLNRTQLVSVMEQASEEFLEIFDLVAPNTVLH